MSKRDALMGLVLTVGAALFAAGVVVLARGA
jgi:hypothetical protein